MTDWLPLIALISIVLAGMGTFALIGARHDRIDKEE